MFPDNIVIDQPRDLNLIGIKMPVIALYEYPVDFPTKCVARLFDGPKPTGQIIIRDCTWALQFDISCQLGGTVTWFERCEEDDEKLVGCFIL